MSHESVFSKGASFQKAWCGMSLEGYPWPLGVSTRRNLGRSLPVRPGASETILEVMGSDDEYATYMTITLNGPFPDQVGDFPPTQNPRATAIIDWGNAGTQARALIDYVQGAMVSVSASFVRVVGRNEEDPGDPNSGSEVLGAFIGYLPRPGHVEPPTFTQDGGTGIGAGASGLAVPIPPFASGFKVLARLDTPLTFAVEYLLEDGATVLTRQRLTPPDNLLTLPIPNGTRFVRVLNFAGAVDDVDDVRFVFFIRL